MNGFSFREAPCLEYLLELKLNQNLQYIWYTHSVVKDAGKMVGYLYHCNKYLILPDITYICKIYMGTKIYGQKLTIFYFSLLIKFQNVFVTL